METAVESKKPVVWMGSSLGDLQAMSDAVKSAIGGSLRMVQFGLTPFNAKPMTGFSSDGVFEIRENDFGDTYRAVYAVKISDCLYVLHVFKKKSTQGDNTPKIEMDAIQSRLKDARQHAEQQSRAQKTDSEKKKK